MAEQNDEELVPRKQSLFPLTPDDIVDNALQNLTERQAADVTRKAADEVVKLAIDKRKAEYRSATAQEEMRNLINNADLLDQRGGDYKINSSFETATGTTNVEIHKSSTRPLLMAVAVLGLIAVLLAIYFVFR
jgi:hypothetical protein